MSNLWVAGSPAPLALVARRAMAGGGPAGRVFLVHAEFGGWTDLRGRGRLTWRSLAFTRPVASRWPLRSTSSRCSSVTYRLHSSGLFSASHRFLCSRTSTEVEVLTGCSKGPQPLNHTRPHTPCSKGPQPLITGCPISVPEIGCGRHALTLCPISVIPCPISVIPCPISL